MLLMSAWTKSKSKTRSSHFRSRMLAVRTYRFLVEPRDSSPLESCLRITSAISRTGSETSRSPMSRSCKPCDSCCPATLAAPGRYRHGRLRCHVDFLGARFYSQQLHTLLEMDETLVWETI